MPNRFPLDDDYDDGGDFKPRSVPTWKEIFSPEDHEGKGDGRPRHPRDGQEAVYIHELLPASYRGGGLAHDVVPAGRDIAQCIDNELNLDRLTAVFGWLWLIGMPVPPRPLHQQALLSRKPTLTHKMDMHLLWAKGHIFLKPIPRFLLEPRFWADYLTCRPACGCSASLKPAGTSSIDILSHERPCQQRKLRKRALGFLYSYAALLPHESDFYLAKEKQLVPRNLDWQSWRLLVDDLVTSQLVPRNIDARFLYGELRLRRLNLLYICKGLGFYMSRWTQYDDFFRANFSILASATVYVAIVLSAMQVGLTVDDLEDNPSFQSASYGFTIFSILGPLILVTAILMAFLTMFVFNLFKTWRFHRDWTRCVMTHADKS